MKRDDQKLGVKEDGSEVRNPTDAVQMARAEALIATIHRLENEGAIHLKHAGDMISHVLVNENGYRQLVKEGIKVEPLGCAPEDPYSAYKYAVNHRAIYNSEGHRCSDSLNGVLSGTQLRQAFEPILTRMAHEEREEMRQQQAGALSDNEPDSHRREYPWLDAAKNGITRPTPKKRWAETLSGLDAAKDWANETPSR